MKRSIEDNENLRKNLRYLRTQRELTQKELAKLLGFPKGTYGSFESYGEGMSSERLNAIFDFYGISEEIALMNHETFVKRMGS